MKFPIYKPEITDAEKNNVLDCLESTWISSRGKYIELFENEVAQHTGANYAVATFNGTVALHLALEVYGIKAGDEVIVPDFTYVASANCVKYTGADVVFSDVDEKHWNITLANIKKKITPRTKAIMVVDIYGTPPCEIEAIRSFSKKQGLILIEDAAESLGASINGKMAGNLADIAVLSFFGNKTITTGEGGMVLTNDASIASKLRQLRNQGNSETVRYFHEVMGYNYRMTNIQAAIGLAQMERIGSIIERKQQIDKWYRQILKGAVSFQNVDETINSSCWMVAIRVSSKELRDTLISQLEKHGIETRPFFFPIHQLPYYTSTISPVAVKLSETGLCLPSYPMLTQADIEYIGQKILMITGEQV